MMSLCQSVLFNLPHCSVSSSSFRGQSNKSLQSHTATSFTSLVRQKRRSVSCNIRLFLPNYQLFCPPQCLPALLPYATSVAGLKTLRLLGRKKANSYLCHQNSVFKPPTSALGCQTGHLTSCTRLVSCLNWAGATATAAYLAQSRPVWLLRSPRLMQTPGQRETLRLGSLPRLGQILTRGGAG